MKGFSQQGTIKDSIVSIKVPVARLVIKDLLTGDGAKQELTQANLQIGLYKSKLNLKQEEVTLLNIKVVNLEDVLQSKNEQFKLQTELSNKLEKELRAEKRKTLLYKVGTGIGLVLTAITVIK